MAKSDHIAGNKAGEIGIIEYSDISCPFCKKVHPTITQIIKEDTSLFWIYRHHPLTSIHKLALEQAIATECVAQKKGDAVFFETLAKFMKETK